MEGKKIHVVISNGNGQQAHRTLQFGEFFILDGPFLIFCATLSSKHSTVCDTVKQTHINLNLL